MLAPSLLPTSGNSGSPRRRCLCPCPPVPCSCPPSLSVTQINSDTELALAQHPCLCVLPTRPLPTLRSAPAWWHQFGGWDGNTYTCTHTHSYCRGSVKLLLSSGVPNGDPWHCQEQGTSSLGHSMHSLNTWPWVGHPRPLLAGLWVPGALQAHVAEAWPAMSLCRQAWLCPISQSPPCFPAWGSWCSCQLSTSTSLSITPCATATRAPACHMPCPHPQNSPGEVSLQPCPWKGCQPWLC